MMSPALETSARQDWEMPPEFFARLDREFGFTLDVCAHAGNTKCPRYFSPEDDSLVREWVGACWLNPPYGRGIGRWVRKAAEAARAGALVVALVPARVDAAWWQDYALLAHEIRFVRGRLRFVGSASGAPFPSAVLVFRPGGRDGGIIWCPSYPR